MELTEEFSGPWGLSHHEGIKFGEDEVAKLVGPLVMDSEIVGSISFDEVCQKVVKRTPKTKKKKFVLDFLKKEEFLPSYFNILQPRCRKIST